MNSASPVSSISGPEASAPNPGFSPPIYWSEKVVLLLLSLHLGFLPWAIGTMHLLSQQISLALAGVAFLTAVFLNPPSTHVIPRMPAWKKLLRSPAFWIGNALLGYIAIQALNPAYTYIEVVGFSWVVPIDHIAWLPSGMKTPIEQMNPFRHLMIFGAMFLTLWTILLFLERLTSIRILIAVLAFNAVALGGLAFAQLFTGADQIFWRVPSSSINFYGTFIYRNHAAGYLNLLLALSTGLYFHFRQRAWKTNGSESDKSPIFFFTSTILFTTVLFSASRGGIIVAALILLLAILYTLIQAWRWNRLREGSVISAVLLGLLLLFTSVFTVMIGPERIVERFKLFTEDHGGASVRARIDATKATADMFRDRWLFGWGAGSFEYAFPAYQENYPAIFYQERRRGKYKYMLWEYAHNDWIQYPAEYGVVGSGLILVGLAAWLIGLYRCRAWRQPLAVWLTLGVMLTFCHAFGDFVLQNPAIIITVGAAIALGLRSAQLESQRRRPKDKGRRSDN